LLSVAKNGLNLINDLKTMRVRIVALIKVAQACGKYSAELNEAIMALDKVRLQRRASERRLALESDNDH
jgi:hypothetical protein